MPDPIREPPPSRFDPNERNKREQVIARCTSTADVIAAVNHGRENGLPIAVHGGGHGVTGHAVCDDGVMIDLRPMKGIDVDPERRTARAQAGLTWGEFDAATQLHGLAVTGGRMSTTGVAGLTLGSGSGWLERKLGFTADNLLSADVVLADGSAVTASGREHPDLFWGLRGGGGNFGIVTSFEFQLHPAGPTMLGGMLIHPGTTRREVLRFFWDDPADTKAQRRMGARAENRVRALHHGPRLAQFPRRGRRAASPASPRGREVRALQRIKDRYDPESVFQLNQNIRPSGSAYGA